MVHKQTVTLDDILQRRVKFAMRTALSLHVIGNLLTAAGGAFTMFYEVWTGHSLEPFNSGVCFA